MGGNLLALKFLKMRLEYNIETQDPEWGIPNDNDGRYYVKNV